MTEQKTIQTKPFRSTHPLLSDDNTTDFPSMAEVLDYFDLCFAYMCDGSNAFEKLMVKYMVLSNSKRNTEEIRTIMTREIGDLVTAIKKREATCFVTESFYSSHGYDVALYWSVGRFFCLFKREELPSWFVDLCDLRYKITKVGELITATWTTLQKRDITSSTTPISTKDIPQVMETTSTV